MKLADALTKIGGPVRGMTSMIAGLMSLDPGPLAGKARVAEGLSEAREKLEGYRKQQRECKSDWAWWAYQGDISYWETVVALFEAAEIVGPDDLPDVHYDDTPGVVMDMCAKQERFGQAVLKAARSHPTVSGEP